LSTPVSTPCPRRSRSRSSTPTDAVERLFSPVWRLKRLEQGCVSGADRVLAVVKEGKDHYVEDCAADPGDVYVAPNYVDTEEFPGGDVTPAAVDGEFVMLYVGTIGGRHRGLETVIRALPSVRERVDDPRFLVVGTGPYTDRLRAVSRRLGVADLVTFTGWVDFEELPGYVAASDVGLVPHRNNLHTATTIPHKLTQYMAVGTPVITSDVVPLERIVTDARAGLVFPAGDPDGLAEVAVELAEAPEQKARLGATAREAVKTTYNWATAGIAVRALYDDLTTEPRATAASSR
jgi:glycosyltransferase involved in cell wall biosynthesis